jgi:hypothetical protein
MAVAASLSLILSACPGGDDDSQETGTCAAGETACGSNCCTAGEACDTVSSTCVQLCLAGETACGTKCCAAGESCDAATSTCSAPSQCQAGETACGARCCAAGESCDAATSTCSAPVSCQASETACGTKCCAAGESCDAATSTCSAPVDPNQLDRCWAPASFSSTAFDSSPTYTVDQDGYEYTANHVADAPYAQMLSVAVWPLSASTRLTGTFDLAAEPFTYAECEHCVLVIAGKSSSQQKHYLAKEGTLSITALSATHVAGSLSGVKLIEVTINESTFATSPVQGGCSIEIPTLAFDYTRSEDPLDPHVEQCFVPETYGSDQFRDFIYDYEANDAGWFYRAIEMPDTSSSPNVTLFIEAYAAGTGSFPLAGCEVDSPSCKHMVVLEAQVRSGEMKTYVSSGGTLVLTEQSDTAMVGRLENVTLVETVISNGVFTPVSGGCSTSIPALSFSSRDATAR